VSGLSLPTGPIIQGYVDIVVPNNRVYNQIHQACQNGVNVLTWSFIELTNNNGLPEISLHSQNGGIVNFTRIAQLATQLKAERLFTTHLISIGGWGVAHPVTLFSAQVWYTTWRIWNEALMTIYGFKFDGLDWAVGGEDPVSGANNHFSLALLDLMGQVSRLAKADGYIVTLSPAQSYLDVENTAFSLNVNLSQSWALSFPYHGANVYAYLVAKYDQYIDAYLLQVDEGWSRAGYAISITRRIDRYFANLVRQMTVTGWMVRFSQVPSTLLRDLRIKIDPRKLIIILANGWATPQQAPNFTQPKFSLFWPEAIRPSWDPSLYRGFGFWEINFEGRITLKYNVISRRTFSYRLYLAKDLNAFVHSRSITSSASGSITSSASGSITSSASGGASGSVISGGTKSGDPSTNSEVTVGANCSHVSSSP